MNDAASVEYGRSIERGSFMSQQEQDAVIGRVVRERQEAHKTLAVLDSEAKRLGKQLSGLGEMLQIRPATIVFENQMVAVHHKRQGDPLFNPNDISVERIIKLTEEIRGLRDRLDTLQNEAKNLGI